MRVLRKIAPGIYLTLLAACLLLIGSSALAWAGDRLGPPWAYAFDDLRFDAVVWFAPSESDGHNQRGRMADDLIKHHLSPGKPLAEMEQLLGKPDFWEKPESFERSRTGRRGVRVACYHIGAWSKWRWDGDVLAISLDASNRVVRAWHYQT